MKIINHQRESMRRVVSRLMESPGPNIPGRTDKSVTQPCGCREPKQHRDCAYCGYGGDASKICGVCNESGIDGPMIPGTGRRTCADHKGK